MSWEKRHRVGHPTWSDDVVRIASAPLRKGSSPNAPLILFWKIHGGDYGRLANTQRPTIDRDRWDYLPVARSQALLVNKAWVRFAKSKLGL